MLSNLKIYLATVQSTDDPKNQGGVKLVIPKINKYKTVKKTFLPTGFASGEKHGLFFPVQKGDMVLAIVDGGSPEHGYYLPAYPRVREMPDGITHNRFAVITPNEDKITIGKNGNILIENEHENTILITNSGIEIENKSGNKITVNQSSIEATTLAGGKLKLDGKALLGNGVGSIKSTNNDIIGLIELMVTTISTTLFPPLEPVMKVPIQLAKTKNNTIFA